MLLCLFSISICLCIDPTNKALKNTEKSLILFEPSSLTFITSVGLPFASTNNLYYLSPLVGTDDKSLALFRKKHSNQNKNDTQLTNFKYIQNSLKKYNIINNIIIPKIIQNDTLTLQGNILASALTRSIAQTTFHPLTYTSSIIPQNISNISPSNVLLKYKQLWKGADAQFMTSFPYGAISAATSNLTKKFFNSLLPWNSTELFSNLCAHTTTAAICFLIGYPQSKILKSIIKSKQTNLISNLHTLFAQQGIKYLYDGIIPTFLNKLPSIVISFLLMNKIKENLFKLFSNIKPSPLKNTLISSLASGIVITLLHPLEGIKGKVNNLVKMENLRLSYTDIWRAIKNNNITKQTLISLYSSLPKRLLTSISPSALQSLLLEYLKISLINSSKQINSKNKPLPPSSLSSPDSNSLFITSASDMPSPSDISSSDMSAKVLSSPSDVSTPVHSSLDMSSASVQSSPSDISSLNISKMSSTSLSSPKNSNFDILSSSESEINFPSQSNSTSASSSIF